MKVEEVISRVAELCRQYDAQKVILYGSRAKGTALERSDIDIAVSGVKDFDTLSDEVEDLPTLYSVDLLNLDTCRLDALAEARQRDLSDSFVLSGTSAKFSITFDLSWKVMKDILVQYYSITGFVTSSPREVLRESFKAKLISDDAWMDMLKVRNELAHDYDCEVVRTHCNTIVEKYIDLFYDFKNTIDELLKVG